MISGLSGLASITYTEITVTVSLTTAQVDASDIMRVTGGGADVGPFALGVPTGDAKKLTLIGMGNGNVTIGNGPAYNTDLYQDHTFTEGSIGEYDWIEELGRWRGVFTP